MSAVLKLKNYFVESIAEMKKVAWPTRQQALQYTVVVIIFSISMALFFGILDYVFSLGLNFLLNS